MGQTSLITDAARQALQSAVTQLDIDIANHTQGGVDQHDTQVILDEPYVDDNGDTLSAKTLKIGASYNGVYVYLLLPALPAA